MKEDNKGRGLLKEDNKEEGQRIEDNTKRGPLIGDNKKNAPLNTNIQWRKPLSKSIIISQKKTKWKRNKSALPREDFLIKKTEFGIKETDGIDKTIKGTQRKNTTIEDWTKPMLKQRIWKKGFRRRRFLKTK